MAWKLWMLTLVVVLVGCGAAEDVDTTPSTPPGSTTPSSLTTTTTTTTTPTTTTTAAAPCRLEIIDPQPDAVIVTAVYTFQGVTGPGCAVDVGDKYFADVDDNGNWSMDLMLRSGGNTTTITASNRDGAKTATQLSVTYAPIVLGANGLGVVSLGDPTDSVIATLTDLFGDPSSDKTLEYPFYDEPELPGPNHCMTATGFLCFDYIRFVSWDVGLWLVLADIERDGEAWVQAPPNLRNYSYEGADSDPALTTAEGITVGSTVADLQRIYGDAVIFGLGCGNDPEYSVIDPTSTDGGSFHGSLSHSYVGPDEWETLESGDLDPASLDPDGIVMSIGAGTGGSC